jgi:hypothetical protein
LSGGRTALTAVPARGTMPVGNGLGRGGRVARPEWPIDPAAGPVQSFAYELRKVRAAAGNPTYRALAKTAGYSAATLSDAARGVRRPTLDVVLAYVGACGGDVDEWRRRWNDLDAARSAGPPADTGHPHPAEPGPPVRRPRRRWLVLGAAATVVVTAVATVALVASFDRPAVTAGACPRLPDVRLFTGETYGAGAPVRSGASESEPVLRTVPSNCTLGFTGYCLGTRTRDATSGTPDVRWFILPDGTVVPSGIIHGNPPATAPPARCRNDRPGPGSISLALAADTANPGGIVLTATGRNLEIVGFAVRHAGPADAGAAPWRQLSLRGGDAFTDAWHPARSTGVPASEPVTVVAAACLGGNGPTGVVDAKAAPAGDPAAARQPPLAPHELTAAAASACRYPAR